MTDEVWKSGNIECYTPSVEHFRQNVILEGKGGELQIWHRIYGGMKCAWMLEDTAYSSYCNVSFITENIPSVDTTPN
jgi:hypothetical protein